MSHHPYFFPVMALRARSSLGIDSWQIHLTHITDKIGNLKHLSTLQPIASSESWALICSPMLMASCQAFHLWHWVLAEMFETFYGTTWSPWKLPQPLTMEPMQQYLYFRRRKLSYFHPSSDISFSCAAKIGSWSNSIRRQAGISSPYSWHVTGWRHPNIIKIKNNVQL